MKSLQHELYFAFMVLVLITVIDSVKAQSKKQETIYHIYSGNTHAHTSYTWSHGEEYIKSNCKGIVVFGGDPSPDSSDTWKSGYVKGNNCPAIIIMKSSQYPGPNEKLKDDWQKYQGPPASHFALAKENNYDFYVSTDHSQEYIFNPPDISNKAWVDTKKDAEDATDNNFVALRGYEHSENNGPNGQGHLNILNSAEYLNALDPGVDLPYLYSDCKKTLYLNTGNSCSLKLVMNICV